MAETIQPLSRPVPPIVFQSDPNGCWAACFRCLSMAGGASQNAALTEQQLMGLAPGGGRFFNSFINGDHSLTNPGVRAEAHTLGMTLSSTSGRQLSLAQVRRGLERGYVLFAFKFPRPRRDGHVVVAYGVDRGGIWCMNPNPLGSPYLDLAFLRRCPEIHFAMSIFGDSASGGAPAAFASMR